MEISDIRYKIETSKEGLPTIAITRKGREIYLHSKIQPSKEKEILKREFDSSDVLIVLGVGLGYHLFPLREKADKEGSVLIFDEMISGMRFDTKGAHSLYGIYPDLSTFGKSISNGYSCSFLVGGLFFSSNVT